MDHEWQAASNEGAGRLRPNIDEARARVAQPIVTRFAPAPTGLLHLGHVVNAIYVWGLAELLHGRVLLRVEDHDRIRSRPEFEAAMLEDLRWLGFIGSDPALSRQREREELYADALRRLRAVAHVYACDCSRTSYQGERYPGRCRTRRLPEEPGRSLRVQLEPGIEHADDLLRGPLEQSPDTQCGDLAIVDRDGHWTYQFAVTVDDLLQEVTLVIRGADLVSSTGRQVRLGRLLIAAGVARRPWPPLYLHHPLIFDAAGKKLSKSTGATGVRHLRAANVPAPQVIGRAAAAAGLIDSGALLPAADAGRLMDAGPE